MSDIEYFQKKRDAQNKSEWLESQNLIEALEAKNKRLQSSAACVYIVLADSRERHEPIVSVRQKISDAYEDAKAYILRHNKEEWDEAIQADKNMSAKDFCRKYISAWTDSPTIIKKFVK